MVKNMPEDDNSLGLVQVYTGDGKGKTTAALGLAIRAAGHGMKVYMIQFMKGDIHYGELKVQENIPNLEIVQFGKPTFVNKNNPAIEDIELAQLGLDHAKVIIEEGQYDIVILDELNVAIDFKLVEIEKVIKIIETKPKHVEIIITGRNAKKEIIDMADLVTNMRKVKHYFDAGVGARRGFEN
jgi:cob(I)alamin adenosyltransferase